MDTATLAQASPVEVFPIGKLSTHETLIREIQERITAELVSESENIKSLNGPLGEQIAIAAGTFSLEFVTPEEMAAGICAWLELNFLQSPQDLGPRADALSSSAVTPSVPAGEGSRRAGHKSCDELGVSHCPHFHAGTDTCCYCDRAKEN